ncbi:hypothetical protein Spiaf_0139 [Spirochaeta africana DSM 8902]|uniref:Erythromycin esterase-like enzyme n=2 Tax=Spirochaeta TaxID=146 RepID=H9UFF5_SPIAZ|nr:hypothetical protein Spiaf_0139 [Spirochaeta africana DSM 8902]
MLLAALWLAALSGCASVGQAEREEAVLESALVFPAGELHPGMIDTLARHRVILVGETHYVQEHHELLPELAAALVDYRSAGGLIVMNENQHALSWLAEDYVAGRRDSYPPGIGPLDGTILQGLRAANRKLPESQQITYRYFDMNHWSDSAQLSLYAMGVELGIVDRFVDVLVTDPDTSEYRQAIEQLADYVDDTSDSLRAEIGDLWYGRLQELLEIELRSIPLRQRWNDQQREQLIIDLIEGQLADPQLEQLVINTGMYHAQRTRYMGTRQTWLGEHLAERERERKLLPDTADGRSTEPAPAGLYALAVFGLRGERILRFYEPDPRPIPSPSQRRRHNLVRLIDDASRLGTRRSPRPAQPGVVFLDLSDRAFSRETRIAFTGREMTAVPNRQFDGYLVFPQITVLQSLLEPDQP